jgi:hypothetical protein
MCPFVWRMIPIEPPLFLRQTLRCEPTLSCHCELIAAASTWLRRARAFACLACASRGWPGSIPKASSDLRSGQGVQAPTAVLVLCLCDSTGRQQCCDEPLGAAKPLFCVI